MADSTGTLHLPAAETNKWKIPLSVFFKDARSVFKMDSLGLEILRIAIPAALALAADPVASLIDTVFIGHIGAVELAAVGVSIAIFNQASKITIYPLVSITTSFVAEEETVSKMNAEVEDAENQKEALAEAGDSKEMMPQDDALGKLEEGTATNISKDDHLAGEDYLGVTKTTKKASISSPEKIKVVGKRHIPSASTAIVLGLFLGLCQTIFLVFGAKMLLGVMGVKHDSPMLKPALKYLTLRSFGAPAVLLSLAMQGVFRGFKDTTTPLYATVAADGANIILDAVLIFACRLGVSGAAIAHVLSQYLMSFILLWRLTREVYLLPPSLKALQLGRFLKNGLYLFTRVIAVTFCVTLAASLAARLGATPMAAFQICLQVWLASSLLADGLAVAGQAILASAFAEKDYEKATAAAARVLQMSFVLGLGLAVVVGLGLQFGDGIFTSDKRVLHLISIGVPFVAATQPINSLSFVFDGVNFGASDFAYSAYSMASFQVLVAIASIGSLFLLYNSYGFIGIWSALTIYMGLRTFAGIWRMGTGTGPWRFLRSGSYF
uniref:Protein DETOXIFICATION n=1 Tax=Chenopodium quinoa TaxID=63459 RepID=A0A803LBZ5_CHEQI